MPEIDLGRAPLGVLAAQELIASVTEKGDLAERHYFELKSTLTTPRFARRNSPRSSPRGRISKLSVSRTPPARHQRSGACDESY